MGCFCVTVTVVAKPSVAAPRSTHAKRKNRFPNERRRRDGGIQLELNPSPNKIEDWSGTGCHSPIKFLPPSGKLPQLVAGELDLAAGRQVDRLEHGAEAQGRSGPR